MRPGAYVFGDGSQLYTGLIGEEECAMRIYATVVSTPRPGTVIIDAGSKTLSNDSSAHRKGFGMITECPDIFVENLQRGAWHFDRSRWCSITDWPTRSPSFRIIAAP